ncbi:Protein kinase-like domain superfamily [Sesbania bispinosa]|nr:Protein kinase-like domain superfamily [Sesbania bispinosa]
MICFKIEKDAWIISKFIPDHNYDLVKSSARAMMRSQRHVDEAHANIIEDMDNAGIKPCGASTVVFQSRSLKKCGLAYSQNVSDNGKHACKAPAEGINLRMSQIMHKAICFATKGALTNEATKMAVDHLELGIKNLAGILKNVNLSYSSSSKPTQVDNEESDEEKDEDNSRKVLGPQRVRAKGIANARLKIQLEKKRRKRNVSQAYSKSQGANHADKDKASSTRGGREISNNILPSFPCTQLEPDIHAYGILAKGYVRAGQPGKAEALLSSQSNLLQIPEVVILTPEYQQTGMLGVKSDIYSLGVIFLQILTGRPPMGLTHVQRAIEKGTFADMLDPKMPDWPVEEALILAKIAIKCVELWRKDRPDLCKEVLPELERLKALAESNYHYPSLSGYMSPSNQSQFSRRGGKL